MPSFHIPSVPRGLLLPGLDTHEVLDERPADPTPSGSHVSSPTAVHKECLCHEPSLNLSWPPGDARVV